MGVSVDKDDICKKEKDTVIDSDSGCCLTPTPRKMTAISWRE
jgi:hypothetical protein